MARVARRGEQERTAPKAFFAIDSKKIRNQKKIMHPSEFPGHRGSMESIDEEGDGSLKSLPDEAEDALFHIDTLHETDDDFFRSTRESQSLEQIAEELERSVPVRNNRYHFRVYKNTFVGSECVDYLVRSNIVSSRAEAVDLGRRLASELNLFEHVTLDHELQDDLLFYRFTDLARRTTSRAKEDSQIRLHLNEDLEVISNILRKQVDVRDRTYRLKKYKDVCVASEVVTLMVEENLAKSREEAVELGRRLQKEVNLWHHVCNDHQFKDEYIFFRFTPIPDRQSGISSRLLATDMFNESANSVSFSVPEFSVARLHSIANELRRGLRVKDRMHHLKTYRSCFVACEAVDFMVKENLARSREEAVDLGRRLAKECHLWYHVTNDHEFSDGYLFFRFSPGSDQKSSGGSDGTVTVGNDLFNASILSSGDTYSVDSTLSLSEIGTKMVRGVLVKDRMYKFKTYRSCFVGCEAVDFLVQARIVTSREDAVQLGRKLAEERELFHHVTNDQPFQDGYLFYRFSEANQDDSSCSESMDEGDDGDNQSDDLSIHSLSTDELVAVGEQLRRGVRIKNRQYRMKTYKNCFIGTEAVDYMVQSGLARSRAHAVEIGRRLTAELDFLHHVTKEHQFDDGYLFFRFSNLDRRRARSTGGNNWSISLDSSLSTEDISGRSSLREEKLQFERKSNLRKEEQRCLKQIRREMTQCQQVVMISGPSGCGKSSLVHNSLADDPTALFGSAKFDPRSHLSPFQTLRHLFTDICNGVRVSSDIGRFQEAMENEFAQVDIQKHALVSWIPEMGGLFTQVGVDKFSNRRSDNMNLIVLAMQSFLRAITTVIPLIVCLDNIMWADSRTLEILHCILTTNMKNFMLCATFRDSDIDERHPLVEWQSLLEDQVIVERLQLKALALPEIKDFLATCLKREEEDIADLAELLLERTHGNMFFLLQSLENFQDLSLLTYDFSSLRWKFSVDQIRKNTRVADNVGELLSARLEQLPRDVQQVLKLASCFGSAFDPELLDRAKSVLFIFGDIYYCLQAASDDELLIRVSDTRYVFAHDSIQSAAYRLLPNGTERRRIHWDIGLTLSKMRVDSSDVFAGDWYFAVADQMKLSEEVMYTEIRDDNRSRVARIFYKAGEKAAEISAFAPAATYFEVGIDILGGDAAAAFALSYKLAVKLFLANATALLSAGDTEKSRMIADAVVLTSRTIEDKLAAKLVIFRSLSAGNQIEEQIDFGLRLLEEYGTKIPKSPNRVQVSSEYERTMCDLKRYKDDELLSLPPMSDKTKELSIDVLCTLLESGQSLRRIHFICYALAKLVQLTLKHGVCRFTPLIFVFVGQDCIGRFNDLKGGYRFVEIGLQFQNAVESADEERGRLLTQTCMAAGCVEPLSKSMYLGLDAYKASTAGGDMSNAFNGASVYLWSFFYSGLPFKPLLDDVEKFAVQMLEYKQMRPFFRTTPIFQLLLCLSGQEDKNDDITKGRAIAMNVQAGNVGQVDLWDEILKSYGMQLAVYMGNEEKATEYYEDLKEVNVGLEKASAAYHVTLFFFGLICIKNYRNSRKARFKTEAKRYIDTLRELVDGGAINLPQKVALLDAELASLTSKDQFEVIRKYEKAAVAASRAGFLQDGALANQLCAEFCLREGVQDSADTYLRQAHNLYCTWGAVAVANAIKARHPDLFPETESQPERLSSGFRSRPNFRPSLTLMHKSLSRARGLAAELEATRSRRNRTDAQLRQTV